MKISKLWFLPLVALSAGGCNKSGLDVAPVAGVVTLDGKPLDGATVFFSPADATKLVAPSSYAKTDLDGRYVLDVAGTSDRGALVGPHKVTVSKPPPNFVPKGDEAAPETLPARYNRDSKLTFDVPPGGTSTADFSLTTK